MSVSCPAVFGYFCPYKSNVKLRCFVALLLNMTIKETVILSASEESPLSEMFRSRFNMTHLIMSSIIGKRSSR